MRRAVSYLRKVSSIAIMAALPVFVIAFAMISSFFNSRISYLSIFSSDNMMSVLRTVSAMRSYDLRSLYSFKYFSEGLVARLKLPFNSCDSVSIRDSVLVSSLSSPLDNCSCIFESSCRSLLRSCFLAESSCFPCFTSCSISCIATMFLSGSANESSGKAAVNANMSFFIFGYPLLKSDHYTTIGGMA